MYRQPRSHPSDERLEAFAVGRLRSEEGLASVEEHLLVCESCRSRLESVDEIIAALRASMTEEATSPARPTRTGKTLKRTARNRNPLPPT